MFWGVVSRMGLSKDVIRCETIISLRTAEHDELL